MVSSSSGQLRLRRISTDAEDRLRDLARDKREAMGAAAERQAEEARQTEQAQQKADAARAREQQLIQESRHAEQAAFLGLMRQAGNPGLNRFPGPFMFFPTWGWKFGDYLLDRKGRWWRFSTSPSASGGAGATRAVRLPESPAVSSDELAAMLARHGVE